MLTVVLLKKALHYRSSAAAPETTL